MVQKLLIKNMVCQRCIMAVTTEVEKLDLKPVSVLLGEVIIDGDLNPEKKSVLSQNLKAIGFELIDDKNSQIIEKLKTEIIHLIHYDKETEGSVNFSSHLSKVLGYDYHYLSKLFSSVMGTTIEKYMILQRIEKVKELLVYGEDTLSEIAWKTGYSSVQHLSNQFKKIVGMNPSHYKSMQIKNRKGLDMIK